LREGGSGSALKPAESKKFISLGILVRVTKTQILLAIQWVSERPLVYGVRCLAFLVNGVVGSLVRSE